MPECPGCGQDVANRSGFFADHKCGTPSWSKCLVPASDPPPWPDWPDELCLGRSYLSTALPILRALPTMSRKDT